MDVIKRRCSITHAALFVYIFNVYFVYVNTVAVNHDLPPESTKHLFSLRKYNDIWSMAVTKLSEKELFKLKKTFLKLDSAELDFKHAGDKEMRESVSDHLNEVLKEYGLLEDAIDTLHYHDAIRFGDERLNQLWREAVDGGQFSKAELKSLHKEMSHMQTKMKQHRTFTEKVADYRKFINRGMEDEPRAAGNIDPREEEMKSMLKANERNITEGIKNIEVKVQTKGHLKKMEENFTDKRVIELWENVKKSGKFSDSESRSIRVELAHFQTQIDKLNFWESREEKLSEHEEDNNLSEEYLETIDKIKEHERKVKKYHATMMEKVRAEL